MTEKLDETPGIIWAIEWHIQRQEYDDALKEIPKLKQAIARLKENA